jgi:hypothetical protein
MFFFSPCTFSRFAMCLLITFCKVNIQKERWFNGEWQCVDVMFKATIDKGLGTKSVRTNLKQIEPWIGPFFTLKKTFKKEVQWMCLKAWGPIWGFNIKIVWLTCERIRLILVFSLFFLFSMVFLSFCFHFHFVHLERLKMLSFYQSPCKDPQNQPC